MGLHCRKMVATINTLKHYLCQCKSMVGTINTLKHVKYYIIIALSPEDGRINIILVNVNPWWGQLILWNKEIHQSFWLYCLLWFNFLLLSMSMGLDCWQVEKVLKNGGIDIALNLSFPSQSKSKSKFLPNPILNWQFDTQGCQDKSYRWRIWTIWIKG